MCAGLASALSKMLAPKGPSPVSFGRASRVLASGEVATIFMFQVLLDRLYVTLALTRPGIPVDAPAASVREKLIESSDTLLTSHTRYDQLLVPLWRVFRPSFCWVRYVLPSMVNWAFPILFAYRPGMELYVGWLRSRAIMSRQQWTPPDEV